MKTITQELDLCLQDDEPSEPTYSIDWLEEVKAFGTVTKDKLSLITKEIDAIYSDTSDKVGCISKVNDLDSELQHYRCQGIILYEKDIHKLDNSIKELYSILLGIETPKNV
jgi:hypothetical protein